MTIDKALYSGVQSLNNDGPGMEIEIENPDSVHIQTGDMEIEIEPGQEFGDFGENLAEVLDDRTLQSIGSELVALVDADMNSRADWIETYVKGLEVLGLKYEERTEPWNGACGVFSTVLTEAAIRFQAESIMESFPAAGPVRSETYGNPDKKMQEAASRVETDMNFRIVEKMPEYRPEHERMLFGLGLAGSSFKKVYDDPVLGRQTSIYVTAEDVIVPYGASSLMTAERVTHVMRKTKNELKKLQAAGFYRDVDLGEPQNIMSDVEKKKATQQGYKALDDDRYQFLEICTDWDIEGLEDLDENGEETGIGVPYVITIDRGTNKVLAIRRNWEEDDDKKIRRCHFVDYCYIPGFGFYGMGLIHIIGGYARAGTSLIRQLVDSGTLSNLPGGLKTRGARIKGDDTPINPGEFRDVDIPSGAIKDNIMTLPYKEPSQTLLTLLNQITDEGRRLGSIGDLQISDMSANAPVGTTLALLERTLKTMSAVQARVHYSMKQEFKLLKEIIKDYAPDEIDFEEGKNGEFASRQDYELVDVVPVSDPNSSTMAQRIMQYQAVMQLAAQAPQIYNLPNLHRQMIDVLGVKNGEDLVPVESDEKPKDPISENMGFLKGEPTKAFIYQDHDAHIATHTTFMQDPMIAQQIGQNPMANQIMAAVQAHIAEHLGFSYRQKIEQQMGVPMPAPDSEMTPEIEVQLSRLIAQASTQLLQNNQAKAQQAQAQQQAQDPLVQMQQQELQIKNAELQTKAQKTQADIQNAQAKLQLDHIKAQFEQQRLQLEAQKTQLQSQLEAERIKSQVQIEQMRLQEQQRQANQKVQVDLFKRNS
jgi:hypothetical protein